MKKKLCFILVLFFLFQFINVNAIENIKLKLISRDDSYSLDTETFNYKNISISNDDSNVRFNFESITNNTNKKNPVSINILLFDDKKENIGFVTYCSEKDLDSNYAQYNLNPKQSSSFYIDISKKYFVESKKVSDIYYYSILDDNKYCHIGGYDKYKGMTFDQISKNLGNLTNVDDNNTGANNIIEYIENNDLKGKIVSIIIIVLILIIRGFITNVLYKIMYADAPILSFLPVGTDYVSIKLAFGDLVAKYFVISNIVVLALSFMDFFHSLAYIYAFIGIVGFIIVIIKLITKKYDMLLLTNNKIKNINSDEVLTDNVEILDDNEKDSNESSHIVEGVEDQMVDISYTETKNTNEFPDFSRSVDENDNAAQNNNDGGSDLTNMFR